MENTIKIAIVSFLCILAHVPTLILRIVPFHEKISDKDRIRLTVIYAIGLAVDFGICMWVGNYRKIDVPFYKINLIAFCIVMAAVNIWLVPGYTKVHLFVFGIVADIVMIALSIGAYVSSLLGMQGNAIGIAETSAIAIVVYALLYPLLSSLLRYTVTPFLEIECQNYWETLWFIPIAMFFSSIFSEGVDVYTTTFPQMLSKCLIGVATLLICFAVSYDQQHFLNEKELNRQIDQKKGYYHALTEQVLAEREARHNFRHQKHVVFLLRSNFNKAFSVILTGGSHRIIQGIAQNRTKISVRNSNIFQIAAYGKLDIFRPGNTAVMIKDAVCRGVSCIWNCYFSHIFQFQIITISPQALHIIFIKKTFNSCYGEETRHASDYGRQFF